VKDLAREHCRLDDATYDGRRLADAALVPRERRPLRAHPVEAPQQVLVAPRVQVVICGRQKKKVDQQRVVNGKKRNWQEQDDTTRRGDTCMPEPPLVVHSLSARARVDDWAG